MIEPRRVLERSTTLAAMALPEPSERSTALVTGASSGIGAAIARQLAARGHGVTLVARREERLRRLASELGGEHGIRAEALVADLADPAERDRLASRVKELGLEVAVLVNNAGFGSHGPFVAVERERALEMARVNVEAVVDLTARYLPAMVERGRGAVLLVASTAAFQPLPGSATYAATKAFVLSFGEALHEELKGTAVTLTTVCPGPVRTEFAQVAGIGSLSDRAPDLVWMSAEDAAGHAVRALEQGRRAIVPGAINQAGSLLGRHLPRTAVLPLLRRAWGGGGR